MRLIPLDTITIAAGRQRKVFNEDKMRELSASLSSPVGLIHPLLVTKAGVLIAGENRLKTIRDLYANNIPITHDGQQLPIGMVPVTILGTEDARMLFKAEFDENDIRSPLTWQERAAALAKLHEFLGGSHNKTVVEAFGYTSGAFIREVREAVALVKHFNRDDIAKAKSRDDAMQILQREDEHARLLANGKIIVNMRPEDKHQLFNTDCLDWLAAYDGEPFKCIITDPPYGIGADTNAPYGSQQGRGEHTYDDSFEGFDTLMRALPSALHRVCDVDSHVWLFCDVRRFALLYDRFTAAGFWCYPYPVIRQYGSAAGRVYPKCEIRRDYDCLLFAMRGQRACRGLGADIIQGIGQIPKAEKLDFGPQKPVAIYQELLKRSAEPGWRVLDCFGGSGTLIDACERSKMRAVVLEKDSANYALCKQRLAALSEVQPKEKGANDVSSSF
jgi:site-specific DNA-methyltransferase (adenine-specific)